MVEHWFWMLISGEEGLTEAEFERISKTALANGTKRLKLLVAIPHIPRGPSRSLSERPPFMSLLHAATAIVIIT